MQGPSVHKSLRTYVQLVAAETGFTTMGNNWGKTEGKTSPNCSPCFFSLTRSPSTRERKKEEDVEGKKGGGGGKVSVSHNIRIDVSNSDGGARGVDKTCTQIANDRTRDWERRKRKVEEITDEVVFGSLFRRAIARLAKKQKNVKRRWEVQLSFTVQRGG